MKLFIALGLISIAILTSCTEAKLFVVNAPAHFDEVHVQNDIVFDKEHNLALDIYSPQRKEIDRHKTIIFFYGGGWTGGEKDQYKFVGTSLAEAGYTVVIPDYRKYPDVKYPEFMLDAARSVQWTIQHQNKKNNSIILMGHSAGANIAFLLVSDSKYKIKNKIKIDAAIGLSGPYNFTPNTPTLKKIFDKKDYEDMRPFTHIDGTEPPLFMGYGLKDELVGKFNIDTMEEKLKQNRNCFQSILYPQNDHAFMIAEFSWVAGKNAKVRHDVLNFLSKLEQGDLCQNHH